VTFVTNAVLTLYILAAVAHPGKERARIEYDEYDAAEDEEASKPRYLVPETTE
jgi:hypothetical protein